MTPLMLGCFLVVIATVKGQRAGATTAPKTTTTAPASNWSLWSTWSVCSESCGDGSRYRARHCVGGIACVGDVFEQSTCNNNCVIPVDGKWGNWAAWSTCQVSCGSGFQYRSRTCNNPAPKDGGKNCVGDSSATQICKIRECPIDGGWSSYVTRPCTATCGIGVLVAVRQCTNPAPQYGGKDCEGGSTKFERCTNDPCVIDGDWSPWSDFTNCTVICGQGYSRRSRLCTNPPPSGGGADCAGDSEERQICTASQCPKDIHICDNSVASQYICTNDTEIDGIETLKRHCKFPDDKSKWFFGLKIGNNCSNLPLFLPVGTHDDTRTIKYGMMSDCDDDVIKVISRSCNDEFITETFNLTIHDIFMMSYHM
ncbi:Hemicentin-1 [Mactra antiquata]